MSQSMGKDMGVKGGRKREGGNWQRNREATMPVAPLLTVSGAQGSPWCPWWVPGGRRAWG